MASSTRSSPGKKWHSENVVPQLLPSIPPHILEVEYDGKCVEEGNELTPTEVKNVPKVSWPLEKGAYYTLMMIDPDAPSRDDPKFRYWLHWLICNISSEDLTKGTTVISKYMPSAPPAGSIHRYLLLVFKQSSMYDLSGQKKLESSADRKNFDPQQFFAEYDKSSVLVSGNFFQAQHE